MRITEADPASVLSSHSALPNSAQGIYLTVYSCVCLVLSKKSELEVQLWVHGSRGMVEGMRVRQDGLGRSPTLNKGPEAKQRAGKK